MRIALFSDSILPVINGVSISVDALVQALREQGHSVHIFGPSAGARQDEDPNFIRFPSFRLPNARDVWIARPPFLSTLREFRRHEFDVIHTHTCGPIGFIGLRWAQSHEIPIVSTYHTLYDRYAHYFWFLPRRYVRFKIAKHTHFYYNSVDAVITPSEASERWLRRHSIQKPITVIPTGIKSPTVLPRESVRDQLGISPQFKVCLFVGRIAQEKNMGTLLQAFKLASDQDPDLRLWVVGDGPYRPDCIETVRLLSLGDKVKFTGFVDPSSIGKYYSAADYFLFASQTETQGLVVNEALAYGLPTILVEGGGASAMIENFENGLICSNSAESLGGNLMKVVESESLCAKLSEGARLTARKNGQQSMAQNVATVYESVVKSHLAPPPSQSRAGSLV